MVVLVACVEGELGLWKGGPVLMFHVEEGNKQTLNYVCGQHWSLKLRDMWTNVFFDLTITILYMGLWWW